MKIKSYLFISLLFLLNGCSLIDLTELSITSNPSTYEQVLTNDEEIYIIFSESVDKNETEELISITTFFSEDKIGLDFIWESDTKLLIDPITDLDSGVRYLFKLDGTIETESGKTFTESINRPFYYLLSQNYCEVTSFSPVNNSSISVFDPISFTFSNSVIEQDFEEQFSLTPSTEVEYSWNSDSTTVTISPKDKWTLYEQYFWKIDDSIFINSSQNLLEDEEGCFLIQEDITSPEVQSISGGTYSAGTFTETSINLNTIEYNSSLKIEFSESVDPDSFPDTFSLTPEISGELISLDNKTWYFVPTEEWKQNIEYNLIISDELEDISGNLIEQEYSEYFTPLITEVQILRITVNSTHVDNPAPVIITETGFNLSSEQDIKPTMTDGAVNIVIELDKGLFASNEAKNRFMSSISLEALFPKVTSAQVAQVLWTSDSKVQIFYTSIILPVSDLYWEKQSYQLIIKSGEQYNTDEGGYLEEDVNVNFNIIN